MSINKISKNFIKALQAKECILFIGSGVSKWSGLPDWDGLLRKLLEFLSDRGLDEKERSEIDNIIQQGDLITAASLCRYKMRGSDLRDFIDEIFINSKPRPQEIHKILVNLGPDSFITTNYDRLIEEAYQKEHEGLVLAPVNNDQAVEQASIIKHGSSRFIFTPHGRMDEVETIIFSREDYRKIQFGSKSSTNCLEHLFVSRPVVYIGFGLKDPDFLMIKDQIASTYSCYEREHFAILPDISEIMKQFWRDKYGINIISYETIEKEDIDERGRGMKQRSHEQLLSLLKDVYIHLHPPLSEKNLTSSAHNSLLQTETDNLAHMSQVRSAIIRFCENVKISFINRQDIEIFASLRIDLSPKSKIEIGKRDLPILNILDLFNNLAIIGSPGSGKTHAIESYSTILAKRSLERLRGIDHPNDDSFKQSLPLILPMKEYKGDIIKMISARLPRSMDAIKALQSGYLVLIFDAMNEVSKNFIETSVLEHDISLLFARYPSNRYIFTSRLANYLPNLIKPVFELLPLSQKEINKYISSNYLCQDEFSGIQKMLQVPLFLSLFMQLKNENISGVTNPALLLEAYLQSVERNLAAWKKASPSLVHLLAPIGYELVDRGSQTMSSAEIEQRFETILANSPLYTRGRNKELLDSLISMKILVPDAEGKVGFFHQTVLEFMAAYELVSHYESNSFSLKQLIEHYRWDETIILFIILLPPEQSKIILKELSEIDLIFACKAFESATIRSEKIGLFLFDLIAEKVSDINLPNTRKKELADALLKIMPFGRAKNLVPWLADETMAGSAAIFLAKMGIKEQIPKMISLLLKDNKWPSDFAKAIYIIADESVISALIAQVKDIEDDGLTSMNIAEILKQFESDALYSALDKLIFSLDWRERRIAAEILSRLESERSCEILAQMLQDSEETVIAYAIYGLSGWFGKPPYKTDIIISKMFELLSNEKNGSLAARYLIGQSDSSIIQEANYRLEKPRNDHELINLCAILSKRFPDLTHELLYEKIRTYQPAIRNCLSNALTNLPINQIIPSIYKFLYIENYSLRTTIFEALLLVGGFEEQLQIEAEDCEFVLSLWEKSMKCYKYDFGNSFLIGDLLSSRFNSISKPLLLSRLSDPNYQYRIQIVNYIARLPLTKGDLSSDTINWLITMLAKPSEIPDYNPIARIIGKLCDESLVKEKLIPLLSSSNDVVKSNAYMAIKIAERHIGKRILEENLMATMHPL